jgi:toxin ParE1/3/4
LKRYRVSREARRDVQQIWAYIAEDNEPAARRLIAGFHRKFEFLSANPRAGRCRDDIRRELRSFAVGDYVIFYRIIKAGVRIMRVIHGRRDLPRLLN